MRRWDFNVIVSILLLFSITITGILGYLQSQLDLRKFLPHRYFAYATLVLVVIHVSLNWKRLWRYIVSKVKKSS